MLCIFRLERCVRIGAFAFIVRSISKSKIGCESVVYLVSEFIGETGGTVKDASSTFWAVARVSISFEIVANDANE